MKKRIRQAIRMGALLQSVVLLAGCGANGSTSSGSSTSASSNTSSAASSVSSDTSAADTEVSLPLVDEKTTLTLWTPMDANAASIVDSLGDTEFFQKLEEKTNVHIEFQHPAIGDEASAYNLMIAGGELPDMIKNSGPSYVYPDGLDAAVDDGYYMDLTDLIQKYAPHYMAALEKAGEEDENLKRSAYTNDGRMVGIYQIMSEQQGPYAGMYVRKDWLDDLGMDTPVTYDDWETMLTAFKDQEGATAPLTLSYTGYDVFANALNAGYGVSNTFYQENGVVKYGPIESGWKDYVEMMHRWYSEGLIDPDFMSTNAVLPDNAMVTTGKTGAFCSIYTLIAAYEGANSDPNAEYVPVPAPKVNAEDTVKLNMYYLLGPCITVSADSPNAELCVKWLDYLFSEEGALLANYGTEGDTFEYQEDGTPVFTSKVTANEDYTFAQAMAYFTMPPSRVCLQDWKRELAAVPEKDLISYDIWAEAGTENCLPDVSAMGISSDENKEYSKIMTDVTTIVNEKTSQFITGVISMDEYDDFIAQLKQMNVDRAVEIVQTVYDRFQAR